MAAGTATGSGDALARRDQALELSGWGQPFRFVQPHNLCFWVYLALSAVGLVHLVRYFGPGSGVVGTGLAAGTIAVAIYGLLFLAFLRLTDHLRAAAADAGAGRLPVGRGRRHVRVRAHREHCDARDLPEAVRPGVRLRTGAPR